MEDPMAAIRVTFFQECEEQLAALQSGLSAIEDGTADSETVNAVFRAVHSMKGGAGIFALDQLVRFAHVFETTLDRLRSGTLKATPAAVSVFFRAADMLEDIVNAARDNKLVSEDRVKEVMKIFDTIDSDGGNAQPAEKEKPKEVKSEPPKAQTPKPVEVKPAPVVPEKAVAEHGNSVEGHNYKVWKIFFKPLPALYAKANEAVLLLREINRIGEAHTELDTSELPELQKIDPEGSYFAWTIKLEGFCEGNDVRDVFEFVEDDCELEITEEGHGEGFAPGTVITGDNGFQFEFFGPTCDEGEGEGGEEAGADAHEEIEAVAPQQDEVPAKIEAIKEEPKVVTLAVPAVVQNAGAARPAAAAPAQPAAQPASSKAESSIGATIRVDLDRVDRMIDLVGELVINEAMLSQRVLEAGLNRASGVAMALEELEHLTREIQDSVMAIRAQPVRSVFQRMPRLLRELEAMTGKQVHLVTEGEGTEVDKTVIERISDPLTHMIRNAVDHGIEAPDVRVAAGKPPEGTIRLTAVHRSGRIVLEVADDGAGISRAHVRQKAIEKGLVTPEAQLTEEDIDNLIFLPGFSTAEKVSDISGRGVGMDVVRQSVQSLGGRISIVSRPGLGSTFTLSLPLTLAVLDGMVVSAHGHTLIIPLGAIVETLKPQAKDVFPLDGNLKMLGLRGGYVPIVDVAYSLGYCVQHTPPEQGVALLVENEGGTRVVLLVDAIHGQRQVVIKSLESNYRSVPGIAAATVMGDGRVALIVDVDVVVKNISSGLNNMSNHIKTLDQSGKAA